MSTPIITEVQMRTLLAENLVYLRKAHRNHLSQKALARILNLPPKTIMNYENGKSIPTAFAIYQLSAFYRCSMEDLLTKKLKERTNKF